MVGLGILMLQGMIAYISAYWSAARLLSYMVPFVPPFFITRTAKRLNQLRAEHDFIKDAEALVMVSFPREPSVPALLCACPDMVSDQTALQLNCPLATLLKRPMLDPAYFANPDVPRQIARRLVADFACTNERGALTGINVTLSPDGDQALPATYVLSSVLKQTQRGLKWQAVFVRTAIVSVPDPATNETML